eukprot:TRINITY_DN2575_c0_g1_i2.p1 TRINITY_DN2575_c0_g1~~TRINITY_DN2575_c0_g1_i2.p1  ORF type:complete len:304 (-),score=73.01 TRINITY_DN2575_c0_g1_i2:365-1276(-)
MEASPQREKVGVDSFNLIKVLGKGTYAKVVLVRKKDSGQLYALKVIKKNLLQKAKQEESIKVERDILISCDHPFIMKLNYAFQNERKIFFALEYTPGGELFYLLQRIKILNEPQAKFYAAQVVLALEHLHNLKIVYRDLKPENIMLDEQGYIRLTDFGLSKNKFDEREKLETICGTPEYLAPEVLGRTGYGKEVDIWAIGALIFEMLTSLPPFYSSKREELFKMIVYDPVKLPKHLSPECKSLLAGLFQKDPTKRITIKDVKLHPWFAEIDWDGLLQKKFKAPFRPKLNGELDLNNFPQVLLP